MTASICDPEDVNCTVRPFSNFGSQAGLPGSRSASISLCNGLTNGGPMKAPSIGSLTTLMEVNTLSTPNEPSDRPYK